MSTYGLSVLGADLKSLAQTAHAADAAGFDAVWASEFYSRSGSISMAAMANSTQNCRIGSSILYGVGRSPLVLATEARDLDELSNGRLVLGIGNGTKRMMGDWHGVPDTSAPALRMEELVMLLRRIWNLHEGPIHHEGRFYRMNLTPTGDVGPPSRPIPIVTAGVRPRMCEAAGRVAGIEGEIGASGLEDGERGHDQLRAATQAEADHLVRADAELAQVVREAIGPLVEHTIGELLVAGDEGGGLGLLVGGLLEELVNAAPLRVAAGGVVPADEELPPLRLREHHQLSQALPGIAAEAFEQQREVPEHPLDGGRLEEIAAVLDAEGEAVRPLAGDVQHVGERCERDVGEALHDRGLHARRHGLHAVEHRLGRRRVHGVDHAADEGREPELDERLQGPGGEPREQPDKDT